MGHNHSQGPQPKLQFYIRPNTGLDRAAGKYDVLVGLLQEKYGCTRRCAEKEIDQRVKEFQISLKNKLLPRGK